MKLIIDISEGDYAPFKFGKYIIVGGLRGNGKTLMSAIYKAIANGTPLEKHDEEIIKETVESIWGKPPCDDAISKQVVKEQMIKYGFHAPDMTVTEFVEDILSVNPQNTDKGDKE